MDDRQELSRTCSHLQKCVQLSIPTLTDFTHRLHSAFTLKDGTLPIVRVCQFHIIQAIRRWNRDSLGASQDSKKSSKVSSKKRIENGLPSLPIDALVDVLVAFRICQRCRCAEDWPLTQDVFETSVDHICQEYSIPRTAPVLKKYFQDNWWCHEWRGKYTVVFVSGSSNLTLG